MGKVLEFPKAKQQSSTFKNKKMDSDYEERIESIKRSLSKIDLLIKELRSKEDPKKK